MYQENLHLATLKLHKFISIYMFLLSIVFVQQCSIHMKYFGKFLKNKKCNVFCVCFLVLLFVHLKKLNKIDVLDLVSDFFRTTTKNVYILK